jgi:hypothetical protein
MLWGRARRGDTVAEATIVARTTASKRRAIQLNTRSRHIRRPAFVICGGAGDRHAMEKERLN